MAPGHALAPVVLRPMEILYLLPGDVDEHLPDLQAWWGDRAHPLRPLPFPIGKLRLAKHFLVNYTILFLIKARF